MSLKFATLCSRDPERDHYSADCSGIVASVNPLGCLPRTMMQRSAMGCHCTCVQTLRVSPPPRPYSPKWAPFEAHAGSGGGGGGGFTWIGRGPIPPIQPPSPMSAPPLLLCDNNAFVRTTRCCFRNPTGPHECRLGTCTSLRANRPETRVGVTSDSHSANAMPEITQILRIMSLSACNTGNSGLTSAAFVNTSAPYDRHATASGRGTKIVRIQPAPCAIQ